MKKILFIMLLMAAPVLCSAQLKVNSNGKASIGSESPISSSVLNLNGFYYPNYRHSINSRLIPENNALTNTGICSVAINTSNISTGRSIGVSGVAGFYTDGFNYGVLGGLGGSNNGAGIFGTTSNYTGINVPGKYAGYFDGPTYCNNTITATSFITPSDITLKENILPLADEKAPSATLDRMMVMNVITYNYKDREIPEAERDTISPELAKSMYSTAKNRHYGLSAQELKTIYPDLVYEGQDGHLGVNYVELVPILIRSIQELKQELDAVKGGSEYKTRSIGGETDDFSAAATGNVLYQNTPNPFKEQTTIRFRLADDAQNAAICIFDMSGKMLKKLPITQGMTSVNVNGYELGEGLYLYSLVVNGREIDTKRMILSK